jgi:dienelactone hydrolase
MKTQRLIICAACVSLALPSSAQDEVLPGTRKLTMDGDLGMTILEGAHRFIDNKIEEAAARRPALWKRDFRSTADYESSVEPNRARFIGILGIEDRNKPFINHNVGIPDTNPLVMLEKISANDEPELVAETSLYKVYQVRWPVLNRVNGEGLLLQPKIPPLGNVVAIPDADQTPEQIVGLSPGIPAESQFARRLAENGYQVLVPVLINRTLLFSGQEQQQTFREWIYRQGFHMGRHLIGYEVQKIIAAIDWFVKSAPANSKMGVAGYGEGGLIAFYAAAADKRIDAVLVSGYFHSRQKVWDEPLYRNVWGLLTEFGDAEIASLIAPRSIIVEYSPGPQLEDALQGSSEDRQVEGWSFTGYKGRLETPAFEDVRSEFDRIGESSIRGFQSRFLVTGPKKSPVPFGSQQALSKFAEALGSKWNGTLREEIPASNRKSDPQERQRRQVKEIEDHIQWLIRDSDAERSKFFLHKIMPEFSERKWSTRPVHPYFSPDRFISEQKKYREYFQEEILGRFDDAFLPFNARTRKVYDNAGWTGYEVVLDVYHDLIAAGILLIPRNIKRGEQRPTVVCQHGRNDVPQKLVEGDFTAYNNVAAKLADQGFIVYAPYNPYRGEDQYRWLHRKANTVKKTLFSFIVAQHEQTLQWLASLSFVDKTRIAFYGLSYGGETAMRVPAVLEGYCLSICSGDFGDWTRKVADTHYPGSFMNSLEWEMPYFKMGVTFSYAEMAYLIFPRPFMVERGHHDLVQPDEWVAYEYAKVKFFYDQFDLGDKTEIEFFNGGHSMRMDGTIRFLHKHLRWP